MSALGGLFEGCHPLSCFGCGGDGADVILGGELWNMVGFCREERMGVRDGLSFGVLGFWNEEVVVFLGGIFAAVLFLIFNTDC